MSTAASSIADGSATHEHRAGASSMLAERVLGTPELGSGYFYPRTAPGLPLTVFAFGFSVIVLSLVNAALVDARTAGFFIPVALATGAFGQLVGGLLDYRGGNLFAATFGVIYAGFLLTTGLILQFYAPGISARAGADHFGQTFGAWLLLWTILTLVFVVGAWYINRPAFLAFALLSAVLGLLATASLAGSGQLADDLTRTAGWLGLVTGAAAWYLGSAVLLNVTCDRPMLNLYPYVGKR